MNGSEEPGTSAANTQLAARMIRTARARGMPPERKAALLAGLGVGAAMTGATATSAAALASAGEGGALAKASLAGLGKWLLLAAAGGGVVVGALVGDRIVVTPPVSPVVPAVVVAAPARRPVPANPPVTAPLESPPLAPAVRPPRHQGTALRAGLAGQVMALRAARAALAARAPERALRLMAAFHRDYPKAVLAAEAEVLRIEAHLAAGDRTSAERLGRRYGSRFPGSPYTQRAEALLERARQPLD